MDLRMRRLLEAPLMRTLVRLAAPNVLVMMVQTSIGLIETYFVASLGTDALAAMALVFPVVMLVRMFSAGGMGGVIQSAVSRTLGAGRREEAGVLAWHAATLGIALGALTSLIALPLGPRLYAMMGGSGGSLMAATAYANVVLGGAVLVWLFNALAAVIRGTGNMALPAVVTCVGANVLIPLSPTLISGWGRFRGLGSWAAAWRSWPTTPRAPRSSQGTCGPEGACCARADACSGWPGHPRGRSFASAGSLASRA